MQESDRCRSIALQTCDLFRRGVITAEEACEKIVLGEIDPSWVAECLALLPDEVRAELPAVLATLPTSDEGWENFDRVGQFDGNDLTWARMILRCRVSTEAFRAYWLGEARPVLPEGFEDRLRAVYHARRKKFASERMRARDD